MCVSLVLFPVGLEHGGRGAQIVVSETPADTKIAVHAINRGPSTCTPIDSGLAGESLFEWRAESGGDADSAQKGGQSLGLGGDSILGLGGHRLEDPGGDGAVPALGPAADHATIEPDGRPGVAVAVEQRPGVGAPETSRAPSSPSPWDRGRAARRPSRVAEPAARGRWGGESHSPARARPRPRPPPPKPSWSGAAFSRSTSGCR